MNDLSTALGRVRNSLASNLGADGVLVLTKGDVAEVLALINQTVNPQGEPVAWTEVDVLDFMSVALRHAEYSGLAPSDILEGLRYMAEKGKPAFYRSEQPAPVAVVMSFDFEHPSSKERRTVALSKQDVFDGMEDYFYDKLGQQICRCESVGETNVVDCNCDEYVHDFEIMQYSLKG